MKVQACPQRFCVVVLVTFKCQLHNENKICEIHTYFYLNFLTMYFVLYFLILFSSRKREDILLFMIYHIEEYMTS